MAQWTEKEEFRPHILAGLRLRLEDGRRASDGSTVGFKGKVDTELRKGTGQERERERDRQIYIGLHAPGKYILRVINEDAGNPAEAFIIKNPQNGITHEQVKRLRIPIKTSMAYFIDQNTSMLRVIRIHDPANPGNPTRDQILGSDISLMIGQGTLEFPISEKDMWLLQ